MVKRYLFSAAAVFLAWSVLDFIIHNVLLGSVYENTADLWRPMPDMKMGVMHLTVALTAVAFVFLYGHFVGNKSVVRGALFGLVYGVAVGLGMGYGTYSVMPIPYILAISWFLGSAISGAVAGVIVGSIIKDW